MPFFWHVQPSCWGKFKCNTSKGRMTDKELSVLLNGLHSLSSMCFLNHNWFSCLNLLCLLCTLLLPYLRLADHIKAGGHDLGQQHLSGLEIQQYFPYESCVKLVYQWWKCCQHQNAPYQTTLIPKKKENFKNSTNITKHVCEIHDQLEL